MWNHYRSVARKAEESTARIMASQKNAEAKSQQIMSGVSNLQKDTTQIIDQNQEIKQILERILAEVQSLKSLRSPLPATVGEAFHSDLSQLCSYAESTVVESSGSSTSQRLKNSDEHTAQSKQRLIVVQPSANEAMQSSAPPHRVSQTSKRIAENSGAASIGTRSAQKLHDAIVYANLEAVEKELNQGADPGGGARGEPPLITAARKRVGDCKDTVAIVKALLRRGVDVNQRRGLGGSTALIESAGCSRGDSDTLKILLEHGADIHSRSNTAYTALAQACAVKDLPKIKLLINAGSEVKRFRTNNGRSLLHLGSTFIISEALSLLLERGADINARDDKGRTPLFESTSYGNVSDMRTLIEKGADILAQDFNGRTLLHAAENENEYTDTHKKEAWQYLLSPGLDPKIADSSGNFPKPH
jgi:ankyrin repeat protein